MFFLTKLNCISLLLFAEMLGNSRIPLLFKRNKIIHKCVSTSQDRWAKFVTNVVCKSYYKEERGGRLKRTGHGWSVCPAAVTKFVGGIIWKTSINTLLTFSPSLYLEQKFKSSSFKFILIETGFTQRLIIHIY